MGPLVLLQRATRKTTETNCILKRAHSTPKLKEWIRSEQSVDTFPPIHTKNSDKLKIMFNKTSQYAKRQWYITEWKCHTDKCLGTAVSHNSLPQIRIFDYCYKSSYLVDNYNAKIISGRIFYHEKMCNLKLLTRLLGTEEIMPTTYNWLLPSRANNYHSRRCVWLTK